MLLFWVRAGFSGGLGAWVFVSRPPSFACAGVYGVGGVIALGGVCSLVTGAVGGVMRLTSQWLAFAGGVCIMKSVR